MRNDSNGEIRFFIRDLENELQIFNRNYYFVIKITILPFFQKLEFIGSYKKDQAKQEARVACLAPMATSKAKAKAEDDLARMRDALAATKEEGQGLEVEVAHLKVEQTSLLLELLASKDEVSSLHSQPSKDKETMVKYYHKSLEKIFVYGYGYCVFKHGIRSDRPRIMDGMPDFADPLPPEYFSNLGCPAALRPVEAKAPEIHLAKTAKDLVEGVIAKEQG